MDGPVRLADARIGDTAPRADRDPGRARGDDNLRPRLLPVVPCSSTLAGLASRFRRESLMHPKERRLATTRRDFLVRSGGAAVSLSSISSITCRLRQHHTHRQRRAGGGWPTGAGGIPLARPNHPVTLERWEAPIASGMKPETGGEFTIFNYPDYIDPAVMKAFGKKYGVTVKVTPFDDINSGITKLASGTVQPDVTEMTPDNIARAVAGEAGQAAEPRLHPEPAKNVWPSLVDPFYDKRLPLQRALHGLRDRHRLPHGLRQAGHPQPDAQPVGHLLAGAGLQGQDGAALARCARRSRWRCCAAATRTSTPRTRS